MTYSKAELKNAEKLKREKQREKDIKMNQSNHAGCTSWFVVKAEEQSQIEKAKEEAKEIKEIKVEEK